MAPIVDITLSVHNGARYLPDQIRSLQAQTHETWRLWIRDDGSTDGSRDVAVRLAEEDPRIHVHPPDGQRLGRPLAQGWLLEHLPEDVAPVFTCDADDVWLPDKIERSLRALDEAEAARPGPVMVHTDLTVVDGALEPVAASFWAHAGLHPDRASLGRLLVSNVVTGPTVLVNRALLELALPVPAASPDHDWWLALVATAFGALVALPEATVLYRRHGANATGDLAGPLLGGADALRRAADVKSRTAALRRWIRETAAQADTFLGRFESRLTDEQVALLRDVAAIPRRGPLARRMAVLRHHALPERGFLRNLALFLRA